MGWAIGDPIKLSVGDNDTVVIENLSDPGVIFERMKAYAVAEALRLAVYKSQRDKDVAVEEAKERVRRQVLRSLDELPGESP